MFKVSLIQCCRLSKEWWQKNFWLSVGISSTPIALVSFKLWIIRVTLPAVTMVNENVFILGGALGLNSGTSVPAGKDATRRAILFTKNFFLVFSCITWIRVSGTLQEGHATPTAQGWFGFLPDLFRSRIFLKSCYYSLDLITLDEFCCGVSKCFEPLFVTRPPSLVPGGHGGQGITLDTPLKFCSRNNFCSVFHVLESKKKFRSDPKIFEKFFFLKLLSKFSKKIFLDHSEIFFCFPIHKKLNKSCSLNKIFLFLKKKVVSLKKTSFSFFSKGHPYSIFILVF